MIDYVAETFTDEEREILAPHFTDLDGPVFALVNLPETVKGALFARYSRSPKSLRRLFLDEFADQAGAGAAGAEIGSARAEELYERIFLEYGDDSVAQLGGAHLACEQSSQLLAKVLERGRFAAYLEQSTRYVPYDDRPGGRWRYVTPPELDGPGLEDYAAALDASFETYARWLDPLQDYLRGRYPQEPGDSDFVYRMTIRAKACDTLRGLLPAATSSNVGIFATGQSYEQLLLRMRAHPLEEVRDYAAMMLAELRKVIPAFLTRVDLPGRGRDWSWYMAGTRGALSDRAEALLSGVQADPAGPEVELTDFDPEGEVKVVAACLYETTGLPDHVLLGEARAMGAEARLSVLRAAIGDRTNRRHKPGRGFERTDYRFDVLCDYGAFRDLQRHRPLTIQWQRLSPDHGYDIPPEVEDAGLLKDWTRTMAEGASLANAIREAGFPDIAQYAVPMAYRVRFAMQMNAREAMHLIELRTTPQGHPSYRRVGQQMHRLIANVAGHRALAAAMKFADHSTVDLERLEAERRTEARRRAAAETSDAEPAS